MGRGLSFLLAIVVGMALWLLCAANTGRAAPAVADTATWLEQADEAWPDDASRFGWLVTRLHQHEGQLSEVQRWHLKLLDTRRLLDDGDYTAVQPVLLDIIDHSGDKSLAVRATAALIRAKFLSRDYVGAYAMSNTLMASLRPDTNSLARLEGMGEVVRMLNREAVGQYDLAATYAQQMKVSLPSAAGQCYAQALQTQALLYAGKMKAADPAFQASIDRCLAAGAFRQADAVRLDLASEMIDEGRADQAIALLRRITPAIRQSAYVPYLASLPVTLAQAYLSLGHAALARQFALDSLAITGPDSPLWTVQAAYEVLYMAERKEGHAAAALRYYEKYDAQKTAAMDNAKAIALAYQTVRQQVVSERLKLDALSKANRILQLRQDLSHQAQRSSRLFNALLLTTLVFFVLALFWLWRSWTRFRWLARHDGLTHVYNREHFLAAAGRSLRQLSRGRVDACVLVLDLDRFKLINDTYGHAVGDQVLRSAAMIIGAELRTTDLFGRLGGEEFGILIPGCSCQQGLTVAHRILHALAAAPVQLESPHGSLQVSASIGLTCASSSSYMLHLLLSDADAALYQAKDGGRNQVMVDAAAMAGVRHDGRSPEQLRGSFIRQDRQASGGTEGGAG
ncbi:GGDEF domain-containing protein [Frateuria aurantia]